jgi:5-methylcytosine-specific restriction endonuclease McrA
MAYRKWAQDNPERVRARNRRWAARHREKTREKAKAWRLANPDGAKALWRASKSRRRARELGAPGRTTRVKLQARWDYFGGRCWICGGEANSIDHVIPLARGGSNWPSNLRPACLVCNTRKGVQPPRQVRARRQAPSPHARTNIKRAQNSTGE